MDLEEAKRETLKLEKNIRDRKGQERWTPNTRFIDLVEEVGELANALLVEHGFKAEKVRRAELIDSICDILFNLLILADHYKVDLNKEYPKVLEHIKERLERGDLTD